MIVGKEPKIGYSACLNKAGQELMPAESGFRRKSRLSLAVMFFQIVLERKSLSLIKKKKNMQ